MSGRYYEYVPAQPFANWLNRLCYEHEEDLESVVELLGFSDRWVYRYRRKLNARGEPTEQYPKVPVENALHRAGLFTWDLGGYADLLDEAEVREGFCPGCNERVFADRARCCLWCGTRVASPMNLHDRTVYLGSVCPDCNGPKQRYTKRCPTCSEAVRGINSKRNRKRGGHGQFVPEGVSDRRVCPSCGHPKSIGAMTCRPCFDANSQGRKKALHGVRKISAEALDFIHERYEEGMPITEALGLVSHSYASLDSALSSLYRMFQARNWPQRDKSETAYVEAARASWLGGWSRSDNLRHA